MIVPTIYVAPGERTSPRWADEAITDSHAVAEVFERRGVATRGADCRSTTIGDHIDGVTIR